MSEQQLSKEERMNELEDEMSRLEYNLKLLNDAIDGFVKAHEEVMGFDGRDYKTLLDADHVLITRRDELREELNEVQDEFEELDEELYGDSE